MPTPRISPGFDTGSGGGVKTNQPAAAQLANAITKRLGTGSSWTRIPLSIAVVFGALYLLDAMGGGRYALPLALLVFAGVLVMQPGKG